MKQTKEHLLINKEHKEARDWEYQKGVIEGKAQALKKVKGMLDSRTIECALRFGEWWMKLEQLKKRKAELEKLK